VRLRTLPVPHPQELAEVRVSTANARTGLVNGTFGAMTKPLWEQVRDHQQGFSRIFAWGEDGFGLDVGGEGRTLQGLWVSGDFFRVLGVPPSLGRVFSSQDDRRGCGYSTA